MLRVSTIPSGVPFLEALAKGLLAEASNTEAGSDALALADMLVLLPNRRACRSLREAFWRVAQGQALALPQIQPIGDLDPSDVLIDAHSDFDLPPAIGQIRRRLLLTRLLVGAKSLDLAPDQAGRLADDLSAFLDELQTERVVFDMIRDLAPDHLAAHWQTNLRVLQILGDHWPAVLADEEALDPADHRHQTLSAIAARWKAAADGRRIVAAGSTGSIPATRALLRVIASLPRGEVVLPGLDVGLDDASWQALDPQHPQFGLRQLLTFFGLQHGDVNAWGDTKPDVDPNNGGREELFREVMHPSAAPGSFADLRPVAPAAIEGLSLAEYADPATEAMAIALRLRAALLDPTKTAALITADRPLARRVAIELGRFGIRINDSAGVPLDQTAPGSFLLLTAKLAVEPARPVALLSLLKHPLTRLNLDPNRLKERVRLLERWCLRGPMFVGGLRDLLDDLARLQGAARRLEYQESLSDLRSWLDSLEQLSRPFTALMDQSDVLLDALTLAHLRFAEALASVNGSAEHLWAREAGEMASDLFRELLEACGPTHSITPTSYPGLIAQLMAARPVRPKAPGHPRLFIWSPLEARLQHTDLTVLAGLNEGLWPRPEEPGAWLNPSMRENLGLPPLERRIGQAAHDFVQAAAGGEVVLSRAEKDLDGSPTVACRWLVRLKTRLAAGGLGDHAIADDQAWQTWAKMLDLPAGRARPAGQPKPKPPIESRPRVLTVSDIGLWMNNPYALYAKRILKLRPLEPLEADPSAADRGIIIHEVLEAFVRAFPEDIPPDALSKLQGLGTKAFSALKHRPQVQAIWWPRFLEACAWVLKREAEARKDLRAVLAEVEGELTISGPAGPVTIKARADRLERRLDGRVNVVDYKTGSLPGSSDLANGLSPQLPLEGVMVEQGAFAGLGKHDLAELHFWRLVGDEGGGAFKSFPGELTARALEGLKALIAHFDQADTAYSASYQPPTLKRRDYDHLARLGEWPS